MMENLSHGALETKKAPKRRFSLLPVIRSGGPCWIDSAFGLTLRATRCVVVSLRSARTSSWFAYITVWGMVL